MLDRRRSDRIVHMPAKEDKFEFDAEVSTIFPDMAKRSIPNYEEFHEIHAGIVAGWFGAGERPIKMLDVGASHGAFYEALSVHLRRMRLDGHDTPELHAIDNSETMCDILRAKQPNVSVRRMDLDSAAFLQLEETYDVINCTYVLQFIDPDQQMPVLYKLMSMVKPGGLLILGQKEAHGGLVGAALHEQYILWRMRNGYTREEIEAKSRALKGSMWPMYQGEVVRALQCSFREITETTRTFMFSTLIAYK